MSHETTIPAEAPRTVAEAVADVQQTTCCVVGGGPGGMMLALLLARQNVPVTLLESHTDFARDFRGDTVHPSTLEILDQIGLADRVLQLPHGVVDAFTFTTPAGRVKLGDFHSVRTRFPYIAMLPQDRLLDFLAAEAKGYPSFRLVMGATVQRLVEEHGIVRGVRYRDPEGHWHEVRALLTVAADGRFSMVRRLAGMVPVSTQPPMDVLWFRLPRYPTDLAAFGGIIGRGRMLVLLDRGDEFQIGYVIPKDGFKKVKAAGLPALRQTLRDMVPWLGDRVELLRDWHQIAVLSVASNRLRRWHRPGLLLIGDAAHTMSPVGGVGINYAVQDAVETANLLTAKLRAGRVRSSDLAEVQRHREWPVRVIQAFQGLIQRNIVSAALDTRKPFKLPLLMRLLPRVPLLRSLLPRFIAFGPKHVRLAPELVHAPTPPRGT
jgi:2-polyprenyl-6-methoxyphenol hydroxylase-like FAD-dependent oxidoreductase